VLFRGRYAFRLGADAWAPDARSAARRLADGIPVPVPAAGRQQIDDLPHLSDQEYTLVVRSRPQLVREVMAQMETRFPPAAAYTEQQREHTAQDIAHIVEYLGVALYMDDDELFTGFLTWTAGILEARRVPAASLLPVLDVMGTELKDFPRTTRLLGEARSALDLLAAAVGNNPGASDDRSALPALHPGS
ncbi:cobalamin-binding protein, partial [Streptomyces sp. FT05W]